MAKKASRAAEMATFERGVLEIEMQLAKEVVGVCRDYCAEVWAKSLNRARVPVDFELREAENIYFSKDIREVSEMFPSRRTFEKFRKCFLLEGHSRSFGNVSFSYC